jgi:hypothetical protein
MIAYNWNFFLTTKIIGTVSFLIVSAWKNGALNEGFYLALIIISCACFFSF